MARARSHARELRALPPVPADRWAWYRSWAADDTS